MTPLMVFHYRLPEDLFLYIRTDCLSVFFVWCHLEPSALSDTLWKSCSILITLVVMLHHVFTSQTTTSTWLWERRLFIEMKRPMAPLICALLSLAHLEPLKALKQTLRTPFKSFGSGACDLKPNQGDISVWCNCNIMRVDKTLIQ